MGVTAQSVQQQVIQQQQQLAQGQQVLSQTPANAHVQQLTHQQPSAQMLPGNQLNHNMMIGDYVQGSMNNVVLQNYRQ